MYLAHRSVFQSLVLLQHRQLSLTKLEHSLINLVLGQA